MSDLGIVEENLHTGKVETDPYRDGELLEIE
jgi:hypothetical protein